jgi:hypothetical protein
VLAGGASDTHVACEFAAAACAGRRPFALYAQAFCLAWLEKVLQNLSLWNFLLRPFPLYVGTFVLSASAGHFATKSYFRPATLSRVSRLFFTAKDSSFPLSLLAQNRGRVQRLILAPSLAAAAAAVP